MRRLWLLAALPLLLLTACKGERSLFHVTDTAAEQAPVRRGTRDPKTGRYVPPRCEADGSFEKARDCFRQAEVLRFRTADAIGTVSRDSRGTEQMLLYVRSGDAFESWKAVRAGERVYWSGNRGQAGAPASHIVRLFELATRIPTPPGKPEEISRDEKNIVYGFGTDGPRITVDAASGHVVEISAGGNTLSFGAAAQPRDPATGTVPPGAGDAKGAGGGRPRKPAVP